MNGFGGLLTAELRRFVSRRLFRGLGLAIAAVIVLQLVIVFVQSSKDPGSGLAEAQAEVALCEQERQRAIGRGEQIEGWTCPTVEEVRGSYDNRFRYAVSMPDVFQGLGIFSLILGMVAGASFMGAEWGTGSMTILLTWEPRRGRVLVAKFLACAIAVAVVTAVVLSVVALLFIPVAMLRGTMSGADRSFWWTSAGTVSRDVGLAVFGTGLGVGLATLFRNTAGAIGAAFFYGAILDPLLGLWRDSVLREWLLQYNIARFVGFPVPVPNRDPFAPEAVATLSATRPGVLLMVYAAALLTLAYAAFRSRDVT